MQEARLKYSARALLVFNDFGTRVLNVDAFFSTYEFFYIQNLFLWAIFKPDLYQSAPGHFYLYEKILEKPTRRRR
jgi:hypothetical protein